MILDTTNTRNLLSCAKALQVGGFNVQVTDLTVNGSAFQAICALGAVEVHLLNMVALQEADGGYVDPEELLANAYTLSAKNDEVHKKQMLRSIKRVLDHMCNQEISDVVISRLDPNKSWPLHHAQLRNTVLLQAQQDFLATTLEEVIAQQQSI